MNLLQKISLLSLRNKIWPNEFILPEFQCHRGYLVNQQDCRENTLRAFQQAYRVGYRMIECDVRLTRDRVPVLVHDEDTKRVFGVEYRVQDTEYKELEKISELTSLDNLLKANSEFRFALNIEIKSNTMDDNIVRYLIGMLKKNMSTFKIMVSSFNPYVLYMLQNYIPDLPRALLISGDEEDDENHFLLRNFLFLPFLKLHALHLQDNLIDRSLMDLAQEKSLTIAAWTVNEEARAQELRALGVSSIITDRLLSK